MKFISKTVRFIMAIALGLFASLCSTAMVMAMFPESSHDAILIGCMIGFVIGMVEYVASKME